MKGQAKQNFLAMVISIAAFLIMFFVLDWPLILTIVLAVAIFLGVFMITKPVLKIGDIELERLANGQELAAIYQEAETEVKQMTQLAEGIKNPSIGEKSKALSGIAQDILNYLEGAPKDISSSRHFLSYYLPTANKIMSNYLHLKKANVSADKFNLITERTEESLDLLTHVFAQQRDNYYKDQMMALEVETELLEKTIRLGGGNS
ncbi:5-bromo-4-chloroindolyl phosphate hydrolysis family protein [Fundicoccus culcitae]|uniref:5-bromo-4-chloroindolyl phosphate hydrolysis family protein n=1 Tax=Fundicoccus culcitae TaxID=2969821 RepID=A0ABY5P314_9LACT|nr:5-bromo-4-chloroindolyl phosphate hydrolysis family protein [Fundicoccus culcitae]UUX32954.1 5-bromo-4-chloroindolyl phosphate hydrolysis family protein [Fundicoccus culcitae]